MDDLGVVPNRRREIGDAHRNVRDRDLVGFVEEAKQVVQREVRVPSGYRLVWGEQFENQQRAAARLTIVVPAALALVFFLLFSTLGSVRQGSCPCSWQQGSARSCSGRSQ